MNHALSEQLQPGTCPGTLPVGLPLVVWERGHGVWVSPAGRNRTCGRSGRLGRGQSPEEEKRKAMCYKVKRRQAVVCRGLSGVWLTKDTEEHVRRIDPGAHGESVTLGNSLLESLEQRGVVGHRRGWW